MDNSTPPQLGTPCTWEDYLLQEEVLSDDSGTPIVGQAFAGPMSPSEVRLLAVSPDAPPPHPPDLVATPTNVIHRVILVTLTAVQTETCGEGPTAWDRLT